MTRLLRDTLREWAGEARVPHDLADRALRRRSWLPIGATVLAAGLAVGLAAVVAVFAFGMGGDNTAVRPATGVSVPVRPAVTSTDVRGDEENAPPRKLVAAGNVALSAYYTTEIEKLEGNWERARRVWSLYDPRTDTYERTSWAWVDAAPGLQLAAVVEGDLLGKRIGVLDMNTRQLLDTIDLEHAVGSVSWSPDGTKLLATAYSEYPDRWQVMGENSQSMPESTRIGYYVIDIATSEVRYRALPPYAENNVNVRQDLGWSLDGSLIWQPTSLGRQPRIYLDRDGKQVDAPKDDAYLSHDGITRLSPNGRLVLGDDGLPTKITDRETGAVAGTQRVLQLLAWADDEHVIALGCAKACGNEFDNGLVLVSVDGSRTVPLTAKVNRSKGEWNWVLTPRN
ncbi:selenium-binding family protein [Nonomuraea rhizosphaerae]|uniref:selenium-binding family protein n=1 Tax=Nonomuraea rhizosphaerae TaxID=2665663 RepID=UPI001C5FD6E9|nr:selenium-binding family protein [Nonomuraea rhizosphaerae]